LNKLITPTQLAADLAEASRESILQEAQRLTHGDRAKDYGHPLDDYTRTAALVSALLAHKLTSPITPGEMAMAMVCVKLSRQVNHPKRDNMVDAAGYAWVSQECIDEAARRTRIHSEGCPALDEGGLCHCDALKALHARITTTMTATEAAYGGLSPAQRDYAVNAATSYHGRELGLPDKIVMANRKLQREYHPSPCRVPIGGSECTCPDTTLAERAGVDRVPNALCAISSHRKAPVIGCDCANCVVARNIAATGV